MENIEIYVGAGLAGLTFLITLLAIFKDKTASEVDNWIYRVAVGLKDALLKVFQKSDDTK